MDQFGEFVVSCSVFGVLLGFAVNVVFGLGLMAASKRRQARALPVRYAPGIVWLAATLVGSFLVVALYWLVHESTLVAERFGDPA